MTYFFDESFVIAICFTIFVYLSYRPVKAAIIRALDARILEIKEKLNKAEELKNEARELLAEVEQELDNFELKRKDIMEDAENNIKRLMDAKNKEMSLLLARKKSSAIAAIDNEIDKASVQLKSEFTENVINLVKTYLKETDNNGVSDQEIIEHFFK